MAATDLLYGFHAATKENNPKSYANVLVDNLTTKNVARSCIAREIRREQIEQYNKKLNLIIKGFVSSNSSNDRALVENIDQKLVVDLNSDDFDSLRIEKGGFTSFNPIHLNPLSLNPAN